MAADMVFRLHFIQVPFLIGEVESKENIEVDLLKRKKN